MSVDKNVANRHFHRIRLIEINRAFQAQPHAYEIVCMPAGNVRFCRKRADKRDHCLQLRLTHFVNDHPEVHSAIRGAVIRQYFFGPQARPVPPYGQPTPTWADVERLIRADLAVPAWPSPLSD